MSALTFVAENGPQLALCALLTVVAWVAWASKTTPWDHTRPAQHGDTSPLDHHADIHERTTP